MEISVSPPYRRHMRQFISTSVYYTSPENANRKNGRIPATTFGGRERFVSPSFHRKTKRMEGMTKGTIPAWIQALISLNLRGPSPFGLFIRGIVKSFAHFFREQFNYLVQQPSDTSLICICLIPQYPFCSTPYTACSCVNPSNSS